MNVQLIVAGSLGLLGAAIHGIAGEVLVVRKLPAAALPATAMGGRRMTRAMIHVSWHLTTVAFVGVGVGLVLAGTVLEEAAAHAAGLFAAATCTGFAAVVVGLGLADTRSLGSFWRHPGPLLISATAALAWWAVA